MYKLDSKRKMFEMYPKVAYFYTTASAPDKQTFDKLVKGFDGEELHNLLTQPFNSLNDLNKIFEKRINFRSLMNMHVKPVKVKFESGTLSVLDGTGVWNLPEPKDVDLNNPDSFIEELDERIRSTFFIGSKDIIDNKLAEKLGVSSDTVALKFNGPLNPKQVTDIVSKIAVGDTTKNLKIVEKTSKFDPKGVYVIFNVPTNILNFQYARLIK